MAAPARRAASWSQEEGGGETGSPAFPRRRRRRRRRRSAWRETVGRRMGTRTGTWRGRARWGVRRMGRVGEEMRRVALVQAEAFHVPVALFNDFFFDFFKAEVLSALIYRVRNSPPDRYACLVAEEVDATSQISEAPFEKIVGVVDCTVQNEADILKNLQGVDEYLYVSGIAVLPSFRRRKVGTALLKACEALALQWRHRFMALRAYEDDDGARGLYSKAGYRVVAKDPGWVTWVGRRRRVLMIKELPIHEHHLEQQ
nr:acetyltransferase+GNAT+family [Oryza glaberrima]